MCKGYGPIFLNPLSIPPIMPFEVDQATEVIKQGEESLK
jgi:hypothetical protein